MIHRAWLAGLGAITLAAAGAVMLANRSPVPLATRPPANRPTLALLTSLPLMFGETFSLGTGGSPALARIGQRYNVHPIGVADAASLAGQHILLMAHPRAQPAEALVELDQWVRSGGQVLLLADPLLSWPSTRPLGDTLRPPPAFADTGLLAHWGISLSGPSGARVFELDGRRIELATAGALTAKRCQMLGDGLIARCRIGQGMATVIADADLLNVAPNGGADALTGSNLDVVLAELARFERR